LRQIDRADGYRLYTSVPNEKHRSLELLDWPDERALQTVATQGPPLIDKTTDALNAIVAALHAAATKADDVQLDAVNDAYADVVQVMAVSLRKLNRLLGQLVELR
jgi:hypothetical protein